jgi:hypothetical protein
MCAATAFQLPLLEANYQSVCKTVLESGTTATALLLTTSTIAATVFPPLLLNFLAVCKIAVESGVEMRHTTSATNAL